MVDLVVDLRDVAKTYRRRVQALKGVQMQVHPGEIFGLLGPNGAGKSTLVKIMVTIVRPTRAEGMIFGRPIGHKPTLARVGYLPEHLRFPPYLTARQTLEFFAAMSKVDRPTRKRRAGELLDLVGMTKWADAKVGTFSKGMQQRIGLAQALVNDPDLIVLDEPTDGLDPVGRRETREVISRLRDSGKTIFLNSHMLSEVERVCDRVAILVSGKVVRQGTLDELTAKSEHFEIQLHGESNKSLYDSIHAALPCKMIVSATESRNTQNGLLTEMPSETGVLSTGEAVALSGNTLQIVTDDVNRIQPLIDSLRGQELVICGVRQCRQSLEDFFIQTVSEPISADLVQTDQPKGGRQ